MKYRAWTKYLQCVPGESGITQKYDFIKNPQFLPNHCETLKNEVRVMALF